MITFRMLGGVELRNSSGKSVRSVLAQPKRLALLAYLAHSSEHRFHSRSSLLVLLWPEFDEARGRAALNQAVYYLRRALGAETLPSRGADELGVDTERLWCDAAEFERAVARGDAVGALELYRGDLLSGLFLADGVEWEEWHAQERSRLRGRAAEAAWALTERMEGEGRATAAAHWGRRALALSDDDEPAVRRLVALLDRLGDRAGAVQAYEEFAELLARQYDLEPAPETRTLIERVRAGPAAADRPGPAAGAPGAESPSPVTAADAATAGGEVPSEAGNPVEEKRGARRWRSLPSVAAAAVGMVLLSAVLALLGHGSADRPASAEATAGVEGWSRIAVLPFANFGSDSGDAYLADGMTEEIITRLSKVSGLRVIARTSVMSYREGHETIAEIGRELSVGYLLEGSVRRSGRRLRVAVQLVDAESQQPVWGQNYEVELGEVLDIQREIAEKIVGALPVQPPEAERRRLARRGTADPEAHLLYLRGRHMLAKEEASSFARSRALFEEALERDSAYAPAWSGLSDALDRLVWARALPPAEAYPLARDAARRALELDPELAEAHASLARTLTAYSWDSDASEHHFRRAIALDPSAAAARRGYSSHLLNHGRFAEARVEAEKALELDPHSFLPHFQILLVSFFQRRYDEAIERAEALAEMGSDGRSVYFMMAKARAEKGEFGRALEDLDRADPDRSFPPALAMRGYIRALTGGREEARETLAEFESRSWGTSVAFERAIVHLGLGENDRAFDLFQEAIERRDWRVRLLLKEPMFDDLRADPRSRALLVRAGFAK